MPAPGWLGAQRMGLPQHRGRDKDKVHLDVQCARVDLRFDATARTVAATGNSEDDYCRSHR